MSKIKTIIVIFSVLLAITFIVSCNSFIKYSGTITEGKLNGEWIVNIDIFPMLEFLLNINGDDIFNHENKKIGVITATGFYWDSLPGGKFTATSITSDGIIKGKYIITWYIEGTETLDKKIEGSYLMYTKKKLDVNKVISAILRIWPIINNIV